jgi:hypothetical protein
MGSRNSGSSSRIAIPVLAGERRRPELARAYLAVTCLLSYFLGRRECNPGTRIHIYSVSSCIERLEVSLALTKFVSKSSPASRRIIPYIDEESKGLPPCSFAKALASLRCDKATSPAFSLVPTPAAHVMPCPTSLMARLRSDHGFSPAVGQSRSGRENVAVVPFGGI